MKFSWKWVVLKFVLFAHCRKTFGMGNESPPPSPLPPLRATKSLTICNKNQTPFCQQGKKYPVDVHPVSWEKKNKKK